MSLTFTKLFSSITESTIWTEPHATRLVWITMLAMSDRKGRIWASIPGLANRARVEIAEVEAALNTFLSPDKYSRTPENEGRRIAPIDGGWELLNYGKYRSIRDEESVLESKRTWWNKNKLDKLDIPRTRETQAEAEAEAEALKPKPIVGLKPSTPRRNDKSVNREAAKRVLAFLNEKANRVFPETDSNVELIAFRIGEGFTETQCRQVIVRKCDAWAGDEKMATYLRPKTLFGKENFSNYVGELVVDRRPA